jgi:radical SAM PhpK family P-methyltransferase
MEVWFAVVIDCLLVGHNEGKFPDFVDLVGEMGADSGAYRDLLLSFVMMNGEPTRALDVFNSLGITDSHGSSRKYHNLELLWPAVTYLATFLHRHGFSFDYVNLFQDEKEKFRLKLVDGPRSVAITTTLHLNAYPIIEVVKFVRLYAPDTIIIVGGPFVSNMIGEWSRSKPSALFSRIGADVYISSSEGELALSRVLGALRDKCSLRGIPNVIFRDGESFIFNDTEVESNALDTNMVDYGLFSPMGDFVSLRTAKSCPYSCAFCGFPARAGKYVYLPPDLVEAELDHIKQDTSVSSLTFLDDTCNVPKGRFKKILRMMIRNQYDFRWNCFYRSDHGDAEVIELMAEAGCEGVFLGTESGSDTVLETMNKTARRADYLRAIPQLRKAGIITYCSMITGFPGESASTVEETRSLLEEARPDFFRAQLWYADPVTPVWSRREELGIKGSRFNWSHNTMDSVMAADIVDDLFSSVQNSIWLPQTGFELWSVFYLMRRGMTLARVKAVVQAFNGAVAENIGRGQPKEISQTALARLKEAYRFEPFPAAAVTQG